ncbi:MAG: response regulator transcription factor [Pseudomonadota bacterium]
MTAICNLAFFFDGRFVSICNTGVLWYPAHPARMSMGVKALSQQQIALVIEDDPKVRRVLKNVLEEAGFRVSEEDSRAAALSAIRARPFDMVTLDVHLGLENGFDVLRDIRAASDVPVIMVTGRDDVFDRVVGLEIGADDYITKPFHVREVLARVRAVLRRRGGAAQSQGATADAEGDALLVDGLIVRPDRMSVTGRDGRDCDLTTADFKLLSAFLDRRKRALSRDQLMDLIGGTTWSPLDRTIDNQVARLRKKIERNPAEPKLIKTVRGVGYMFVGDVLQRPPQSSAASKRA